MAVWLGGCFLPPLFSEHAPDSVAGGGTQHLWSLAVEEHFYLLWPGSLAWIGARRSRDWAARLALLVGLWRLVESQMATPSFPAAFTRFPDLRLDALLWGCAVAFFLNDAHQREKLAKQLRFGVWIGMAGLAGLCILYFSPLTSLIVATLIPVLLAGTVLHPRWLLSRFLDWAPVAWLGRISYSLYLWQGMFLISAWEHPAAWWRQWPANLLLSVSVAVLSHYLGEKPLIRIGARLASRCSAQPSSMQPIPVHDHA